MENTQIEKKPKAPAKKPSYAALRIRRETKRQLRTELERINKKDLGRRIRVEDYLALALSLITPQHFHALQEASLCHSDRLERDFRAYVAKNGPISRDAYLGKRYRLWFRSCVSMAFPPDQLKLGTKILESNK